MASQESFTTLLKYLRHPHRMQQHVHSQVKNWAARFTPEASGRGSIGNFRAGDLHHLEEQINNKYSFVTVVSHSRNHYI